MTHPYLTRRGSVFALHRPAAAAETTAWGGRPGAPFMTGTLEALQDSLETAGLPESEASALAALVRRHRFPPDTLRIGRRSFSLHRPVLMGIVNVTPDSFSDGGRCLDPEKAVAHALRLVEEGADIIDVGGESTRPGAEPVPARLEMERVIPVIRGIRAASPAALSIDTMKAETADAALEAGAGMVNDVSGLHFDPELARVVARRGASLALMHMRGTPRTMQADPRYGDLPGEILAYLEEGLARALDAGVEPDRILVDPGIGFGKQARDNFWILENLEFMKGLGCPILVGASRKSFLAAVADGTPMDRLFGTLAAHARAWEGGARVFRVHDAAPHAGFFRAAERLAHESVD
jgi:dihydropteroate synthase